MSIKILNWLEKRTFSNIAFIVEFNNQTKMNFKVYKFFFDAIYRILRNLKKNNDEFMELFTAKIIYKKFIYIPYTVITSVFIPGFLR